MEVRAPADRRAGHLERTMFALQEAREPDDVLAIVARAIAREFGRPCLAYDLREGHLRAVGSGAVPKVPDDVDFDDLRHRGIVRRGADELVGVVFDGAVRALFRLGGPAPPLDDDDRKQLRAIAAHASLALSTARAFEALRRSAAEGAALTGAARTILGFNELEPLADALCRLGVRFGLASRAAFYAPRDGALDRIGSALRPGAAALPERLPRDDPSGPRGLGGALRSEAFVSQRVLLRADAAAAEGGLFVMARAHAFSRADVRLWEALVSLAALALRNVELYEQSTRAYRALAESNAFKDDLMAMFAHDFKGPLTVISGFAELLFESEDETVRRNAQTIVDQAARLAKLSEDALALAATQSAGFSLQRTDGDIVQFVIESVAPLDRDCRVAVAAAEGALVVAFDRARLRHVLDNVVGNALKYSKDAVTITLRAGCVDPQEGVRVPLGNADAGEGVRIDVADRGIGIPPGDLERIFTRFGRAANARSRGVAGSGVGLYVAKKIVEVHGGRMRVESVENEGSTFSITLPRR